MVTSVHTMGAWEALQPCNDQGLALTSAIEAYSTRLGSGVSYDLAWTLSTRERNIQHALSASTFTVLQRVDTARTCLRHGHKQGTTCMKCTHHNGIFRNTGIWYPYHSLGLLCLYDDAVLSFCNQSDPKVLRISLIQVSKADALHLSLELLPRFH